MGAPFRYNQVLDSQWMTGRKKLISALAEKFIALENTLISAPRKWGKTSFVKAASLQAMDWDLDMRVCNVNLFNVRDEELFYILLVQSIIRAVAVDWDNAAELLKKMFPDSSARLSVRTESVKDIVVDFDWDDVRKQKERFWEMPEFVCRETGLRLIIFVDEIQRATEFAGAEDFFCRLVENWGNASGAERNVAYCLCGSSSLNSPVWVEPLKKFAPLTVLDKIPASDFTPFIRNIFTKTGKYIDVELCEYIYDMVEGHPHYVQQLAQMTWFGTGVVCTREIIDEAFASTVSQLSNLFQMITENLTSQQICYLNAVVFSESVISTADIMHKYRISSATSASRSKAALLEKEILRQEGGKICVQDPVYRFWLKNNYFSRQAWNL